MKFFFNIIFLCTFLVAGLATQSNQDTIPHLPPHIKANLHGELNGKISRDAFLISKGLFLQPKDSLELKITSFTFTLYCNGCDMMQFENNTNGELTKPMRNYIEQHTHNKFTAYFAFIKCRNRAGTIYSLPDLYLESK